MVNTFLPFPDYRKVARTLDTKRLGKQRVEGLQILKANLGMTKGWVNHPAAVMWRGHEGLLSIYILSMCSRWVALGYKDSVADQVIELMEHLPPDSYTNPWWMGNEEFHTSHQSNLQRKMPMHYCFDVNDDLPYKWPMPDGTLRVTVKKEPKKKRSKNASNK